MRKWHRWLMVFCGVFMVWIAATGLVGQVISLTTSDHNAAHHGSKLHAPAPTAAAAARDGDAKMQGETGQPVRHGPPHDLYHFIIDLHSGNYFGSFGKIISALMGAALLFFSVSGMWMYYDMFRKRKYIGRSGIFWN